MWEKTRQWEKILESHKVIKGLTPRIDGHLQFNKSNPMTTRVRDLNTVPESTLTLISGHEGNTNEVPLHTYQNSFHQKHQKISVSEDMQRLGHCR